MQENKNAKCPHCGAELYLGYEQGTGLCTVCRKQFDNKQAILLYKSVYEDSTKEEEKKKASFGEEYLEVERIIQRSDYYFARKEFKNAKEELLKALEITNTDYRIYFNLVRAETSDLTDYRNTSHEEYLNKAIECADAEEKKQIMRLYKDFYQLSKLSDEEIMQYKAEENVAIKKKLEERLKAQIPALMKKERKLPLYLTLAIVFFACGGVLITLGMIWNINALSVLAVAFTIVCYIMARSYVFTKKNGKLYNAFLDIYDALDSFELDIYAQRNALDMMKVIKKEFDVNNNFNKCEDEVIKLSTFLAQETTGKARIFITSHAVLKNYVQYVLDENN